MRQLHIYILLDNYLHRTYSRLVNAHVSNDNAEKIYVRIFYTYKLIYKIDCTLLLKHNKKYTTTFDIINHNFILTT